MSCGARDDHEDHVRAGLVTHEEARGILCRFNASHWKAGMRPTGGEIAQRDDDIRLSAYIARCERIEAAALAAVADAERPDEPPESDELVAGLRVAIAWPGTPR